MTRILASDTFRNIAFAVCLTVLVLVAHGSMLQNGFVPLDDVLYVQDNSHVLQGLTWDGFKWAFTTTYGGNWHPLTWLAHMLDAQCFGRDPAGHHLGNLLLHWANTLLLFFCFVRMTGARWRSAAVAALFASHPMHVESVAWISERKDVLCAFFWLLGMLAYTGYVRRPGLLRYGAVFGCLALALLSKPMAVTFPFVLLLLDYWPFHRLADGPAAPARAKRTFLGLVAEKVPLMGLAGVFSWICLVAQRQNMAVSDLSVVPMVLRMKNAMVSYCDYLGLALYPGGLNALYPYPFDTSTTYAVGCAVVLLVLLLGALLCARRAPYIPVGVYWFAGTLLPVIGFVQVGIQAKADRYAYLPYIGLYVAVVWAVGVLVARRPKLKVGVALAFFVILALLVATTQRQVRTWKDGVALFERMLEVNPGNKTALFNLGGLLYTQERYAEAAKALEMYFQMDSWKPQALQMLTDALIELEEYDKAMGYMRYLMRLLPEDSDTTAKQAYIALMCGKLQFSIESLHAANKLEKNGKKARQRIAIFVRLLLAKAFQANAKNKAAYYDAALALDPENTLALFTRAQFELGHGELADAIVDLALARRFSPGFVPAAALLDKLLAPLNTPGNAIVLRQIAWRLATDPQPFRRDGAFALELAARAIALQGRETALTADALAAALAETGRFGEAQRTAERAARLARQAGQEQYAVEIAARRALYQAHTPFHSSP